MVYIAKLVSVAKYKNITDKLKPFVHFQSSFENFEIEDEDKVAILQVEGTESYFPVFLKTKSDAKKLLLEYLSEN
jgi:hypothetical protein